MSNAESQHMFVLSMAVRPPTSPALPFLHLLIAAFCLWNVVSVSDRARVPFETVLDGEYSYSGAIGYAQQAGGIQEGDRLVYWRSIRIAMPQHIELLADLSDIGERVPVTIERDGQMLEQTIELVPFYPSYRFAVVTAVAGLTILMFGLFVYLKRPGDSAALLLHWALVWLGTVTMMTQGSIDPDSMLSFARRSFLFVSYNMTAVFFFLFTTVFPRSLISRSRPLAGICIGAFLVLAGALSWFHIEAMQTGHPEPFRVFQQLYDLFHLVFLVMLALGIVLIFLGYAKERIPERRQALRWIYYGLLVGATPFLLLVVLPQLWGPDLFAPEELATFFTLAIPLSFTIAFLRYHVFSIEIQHRQRLTTFLLRVSLSLLQFMFVAIVLSIFWEDVLFGSHVLETLVFGLCIVLLRPVRTRLAAIIEEAIYPARFNPARLLQDVSSRFHGLLVPSAVGPLLVAELHTIIPRYTFLWYRWNGKTLQPRATSDRSFLPALTLSPHVADDVRHGRTIVGIDAVRPQISSGSRLHGNWLRDAGLSIVIPIHDGSDTLLGIVCGRKADGGDPLDRGEFELVQTICSQATSVLVHLRLQESMIFEQRKRRELEELSRLKSHFVSSVSHDLRTPLTSVSMFLELLEQPKIPATQRNEYIGFIRQETQRLRRLVENVLDFAKAEQGVREFTTERTDLGTILTNAADAMAGQFKAVNASYRVRIPDGLPSIVADAHALERAFTNLLSNAFKYTPEKKRVSFVASRAKDLVRIVISDNGHGIDADEIPKIFDPFYRVRDPATAPTGGVGLGLSLVRRTIEHHGGVISVASRPGKGTVVTVDLPVNYVPHTEGTSV